MSGDAVLAALDPADVRPDRFARDDAAPGS